MLGFQKSDADAMHELMEGKINDALRKTFNPEFINRVDTIIFHALTKEHISEIIDITLDQFKDRLRPRYWYADYARCQESDGRQGF